MNINSTSSVHRQVFNNIGKGSSNKNNNVEEKRLDSEIKTLEQRKASLNKITDKSKIDDLNSQIKQKQAEKARVQGQGTNDSSISAENEVQASAKTVKNSNDQTFNEDEKDNSELKSLDNFVTQTGVTNKTKLKNNSKKHSDSAIKDDSNNSINNRKKQQHAENAINSYKLIEADGTTELNTNILA